MAIFIKRFLEWFHIKERLDAAAFRPPFFNEREIWWCNCGENIGTEISGKGDYFRRPVIIFHKLDTFSFIGIPITSKVKIGDWYVTVTVREKQNTALLAQVRYFDYRRMDKLLCTLHQSEYSIVKNLFLELVSGRTNLEKQIADPSGSADVANAKALQL